MSSAARTAGMGETAKVEGRPFVAAPFGTALVELARRDERIVGLTADLSKYTDILPFAEAFPERFFNVGMAEQSLVSTAAGLARTGYVVFATTYAVFATRRAFDFIAIACAHSNLNVKLFCGLPGLTTGYGATHQGIDDLALMQAIPGLVVVDPCDAIEIAQVVEAVAAHEGPTYVRNQRGNVPVVLDPASYRFEIGKARLLREGGDVAVISTGLMTERVLDAATALGGDGLAVAVLHSPCLKPFDKEAVLQLARSAKRIVTVENHLREGGLGSRVLETLYEGGLVRPLTRVGLPDRYIECGSLPHLQEKYGLSVPRLVETIREAAREHAA